MRSERVTRGSGVSWPSCCASGSAAADEVEAADRALADCLADAVGDWLDAPRFPDGVFGALQGAAVSQGRADSVVLPALRRIARRG